MLNTYLILINYKKIMSIKIKINDKKVDLPLNKSMGGIRIADKHGNHVSKPTQQKNEASFFVEWMITNDEIKFLTDTYFEKEDIKKLIENMKKINNFTEKSDKEKVKEFEGFEIYQYTENFSSFEKTLKSRIRVRITFKLGDYGLKPHPHMYVLLPFNHENIEIMNNEGKIEENEVLGSGYFAQWTPTKEDIFDIIITLAHASSSHRDALIEILSSEHNLNSFS